jgi:hydroxyacyl-ACP dehydratase HTD2-like protein with hotdog domain
METKLKMSGEFEEYERILIRGNKNSHIDEFEKALDEYANSINESFITEDGIRETWLGGGIDHEYIKEMKKQIKEQREISVIFVYNNNATFPTTTNRIPTAKKEGIIM